MTVRPQTARRRHVLVGPERPVLAESVVELIRRNVVVRSEAVALRMASRSLTYGQMWRRTESVAGALREAGVVAGDTVAVWADRTPDVVTAILAVMTLRATYVPLDPTYHDDRVRTIIDAARPRLLVYDSAAATVPPPDIGAIDVIDTATIRTESTANRRFPPRQSPRGTDLAYMIFTSGSTGVPKGVMVEHSSLLNYCAWCMETLGNTGTGSPLFGSLGFDHSLTSLWPTLAQGSQVVLCGGPWDRQTLFRPEPGPYSLMKVTPSQLRFFERTGGVDYQNLVNVLVSGGEVLDTSLIRALTARLRGVRLINHYGPTEATIGCCYHRFDSDNVPALPSVPIGSPLWNTRLYLVDDQLDPVPAGSPAELVVAGSGVARGYVGRSGASELFIDESDLGGPSGRAYRTGDYVELLGDGSLLYLGRRDDQRKISGHRVELGGLRSQALDVPGVADVAFDVVAGDPDYIEVFVVPDGEWAAEGGIEVAVRRALAGTLPSALVPRRIHVVAGLATNRHGKRDLDATRSQLSDGNRGAYPMGGSALDAPDQERG